MNKDAQFLRTIKSLPDNSVINSIIKINKTDNPDIKSCIYNVEIEYTTEINFNDDTKLMEEIKEELVAKGDVLLFDKEKYNLR